MLKESFGTELKKIRKLHKLTQAQLGSLIGVSTLQISYYERGASLPNLAIFNKLISYFNISASVLNPSPLRDEFYTEAVLTQKEYSISINGEAFSAKAGLIKVPEFNSESSLTDKMTNVLLLEPPLNIDPGRFSQTFCGEWWSDSSQYAKPRVMTQSDEELLRTPVFTSPNQDISWASTQGYELVYKLFSTFNPGAFSASPKPWPANNKNILMIRVLDTMYRLYVTPHDCTVYATFNPTLNKLVSDWFKQPLKKRLELVKAYYQKDMKQEFDLSQQDYNNSK